MIAPHGRFGYPVATGCPPSDSDYSCVRPSLRSIRKDVWRLMTAPSEVSVRDE